MHHLIPYLLAALLAASTALAGEAPRADLSKNLATPKSAALMFVRSMEGDDMDVFRSVTIGGADDYQLFEPLVGMVSAAKQLERAARDRYGKAGSAIVRQSPALGIEVHVQESNARVNGDTATVRHREDGPDEALTLRHTEEGWKVDLTAIKNRQKMTDAAPAMRRMREALRQCAADIQAGKFRSPEEAERTVSARIAAAGRG